MAFAGLFLFACDRALLRGASRLDALGHVALWGAHTVTAAALGLAGGVWALIGRAAARTRRPTWIAGLTLALGLAFPLRLVTRSLVAGDWIAKQRFAWAIEGGALAGALAGVYVLGWLYARTAAGAAGPGKARFVLPALLLLGGLGAAVVDGLALPGLYPVLHLALYVTSALLAVLAMCRFADLGLGPDGVRAGVARGGAGVLVAALLAAALAAPGKARALTVASRPAALIVPSLAGPSRIIADELAALDLREGAAATPNDPRAAVEKLLGGRRDYNVLLIVVDTLRADALVPSRRPGQPFAEQGDTPFLDAWLGQSFRFRRAYTQASRTRRSMPPTFRSTEAHEDTERVGIPLGAQATELGLLPVAVVPQYFLLPESESAQHLLLGFDRVSFYEKNHQERIVERAHDAFEGLRGRRFLSWVHFYNMHDPYFADRPLGGADGSPAQRYRKALQWLDKQMAKMWADFEAAGLAKDTVVFFTADHGENVGLDGGAVGHGGSVRDVEVRAPLAVRIPGQVGREIDVPAGNVDIVPTILDLVGAPARATHRGRSLLPVLAGADDRVVPLYFESSSGDLQGVALGHDKLVHQGRHDLFHRYDLRADPAEKVDLYDPHGDVDRVLRRALLRKNPALFAGELRDPSVRRKLSGRLREVRGDVAVTPGLRLLLHLAALAKDRDALAEGERIFREAKDVGVQLLAARHLAETDPARWTTLVGQRLAELSGSPLERAFVEGLASQGQRELAPEPVVRRLAELGRGSPEGWAPWLALVRGWKKPAELYAAPLGAMLEAMPSAPRSPELSRTQVLLLECVGSLPPGPSALPLAGKARPALDDPDPRVAVAAARALGHLRDPDAGAALRAKLAAKGVDARIRQAILYALVDVEGAKAAPDLIREGDDPLLTVDAVQLLGQLRSQEALPFLRKIARTHYNHYTKQEARKAIQRIEGKE